MHTEKQRASIRRWPFAIIVNCLLINAACSRTPASKRYPLQGRVVAVDAANRQLTIAHQDVAGLMKGMTMPFLVSKNDVWVFRAIAPGDEVHATLVLGKEAELEDISFTKGAPAGTPESHVPQAGEKVPDFSLTNQNGEKVHLNQFHGRPLLLTFIYTRCPFPDYCLRMSNNFARVLQQLQNNTKAFENAQLLSISIDPEHDTPSVLREYGERYVGRIDPGFRHWQFASGSPEQVRNIANFFGLAYNRQEGQIIHGLRTALIGPDGKVLAIYSGNDWKPEEVTAEIVGTVSGG